MPPKKKTTQPPSPLAMHETPVLEASKGERFPFDDAAVGVTASTQATLLTPPVGGTSRVTVFYVRSDGTPSVKFEWNSHAKEDAAWQAFFEFLLTCLYAARKGSRKIAPATRVFRRGDERVLLILVPFKGEGGLIVTYRGDRYLAAHHADPDAAGAAQVAALLAEGFEEPFAEKPGGPWPKPRLTKMLTAHGTNGSRINIAMGELVPERVQIVGPDGAVVARLRTQPTVERSWAVILERFARGVALPIQTGEAFVSNGGTITTLWGRHGELASPDPSPLPS